MGKYVESNLNRGEVVVEEAKRTGICLIPTWIIGLLFCWLIVPLIMAIITTVKYFGQELAYTNKRVMGKAGSASGDSSSVALDAPLNKVQSASVTQGLVAKIFKYGKVCVNTGAGKYIFTGVKDPHGFKNRLMAQIEEYENDKIKEQAAQMASAMAAANAAAKQD